MIIQSFGTAVHADVAAALAHNIGGPSLTPRETEVLKLVAGGLSNKRIAGQLGINDETVKGHMGAILSKLEASDRTHAVTLALKRGIIDL